MLVIKGCEPGGGFDAFHARGAPFVRRQQPSSPNTWPAGIFTLSCVTRNLPVTPFEALRSRADAIAPGQALGAAWRRSTWLVIVIELMATS